MAPVVRPARGSLFRLLARSVLATSPLASWDHMTKQPLTVELDESLVEAARAEALRTGQSEAEVVEEALRRHFQVRRASMVDEVWARNEPDALTGDEALALAYDELDACAGNWGKPARPPPRWSGWS